jgi:hypothetical protein
MCENKATNLNKYKIKIRKTYFNSNNFKIESYKGNIFTTTIKKGSVQCKIFNELQQEVNLTYLEENSLVTIIGLKKNNIIVIKKIIVKNNYVFNSDSSDEFNSDNSNYFV